MRPVPRSILKVHLFPAKALTNTPICLAKTLRILPSTIADENQTAPQNPNKKKSRPITPTPTSQTLNNQIKNKTRKKIKRRTQWPSSNFKQ